MLSHSCRRFVPQSKCLYLPVPFLFTTLLQTWPKPLVSGSSKPLAPTQAQMRLQPPRQQWQQLRQQWRPAMATLAPADPASLLLPQGQPEPWEPGVLGHCKGYAAHSI